MFKPHLLTEDDCKPENNAVMYLPEVEAVATSAEYTDDDCDYESGCVAIIVGWYFLDDPDGLRYDDGGFYGYHNMIEWVRSYYPDEECWVVSDCAFHGDGPYSDLVQELSEEGIDLSQQLAWVDRMRLEGSGKPGNERNHR